MLNDHIISIPTGSEDYSFKATRKVCHSRVVASLVTLGVIRIPTQQNIYEENLFCCEDERFELDLLIEQNAAAIRVIEPIVQQINTLKPDDAKAYALLLRPDCHLLSLSLSLLAGPARDLMSHHVRTLARMLAGCGSARTWTFCTCARSRVCTARRGPT